MEDMKAQLLALADEKYREFTKKLTPNAENVLGVRIPALRKIAKEIAGDDWRAYLACDYNNSFEEVMLQGMVIGYAKADANEILHYIKWFIPKINNWAVCDCFAGGLKFTAKNEVMVWKFLQTYLYSEKEFEIRFGIVMLLEYYIQEDYLQRLFVIFDGVKQDEYYVQMAIAWAVSICYVYFPEQTDKYLQNNRLNLFTYRKTIQKIIESNRVDAKTKDLIRLYKR